MRASPRVEADRAELARFIDTVFRYADDGTAAVLRTFAEGSSDVLGSVRVQLEGAGLEQLVEHATHQATKAANAERPAVFAPPVATFLGKRARECDLGNGLVLSVEADHAPAVARRNLEFLLGPATVVVASGGLWIDPETDEVEDKLHLHWRCREPSRSAPEHAVLKRARALSCALVGADATAISLVHPLRWPGSWHRKAEPRLARIIDLRTDVEIEPAEVVEDLEPLVPVPPADRRAPGTQQCRAELDEQDLQALGEVIANPDLEWAKWNRLGLAFFAASGGSDAGFEAFDQLSRRSEKYGREETVLRWQHYPRSPADRLGPGTLIYEARRADPTFRLPSRQPGTGARRTRSFDAALGDLHAEQEQAVPSPDLAQLLERVGQEPSVAFEASSLRVLAAARENDPPAFQRALDQLKRGGVRLRDLERELRRSRLRVIECGPGSGSGGVVLEAAGTYFVARGAIALQKETRDGLVPQLLCNFSARILAEEVLDDGAEQRRVFVIEGRLADGRSLPGTRISAERYPAMSWVTEAWGTGPVIFAGQGKRDHLRAAIQMLSGSVPRRNVYGHLGWRKLGDDWVFIHSTGGLNHRGLLDDVEVETSIERLQDYVLPSPPTRHELRQAVRASLDLLDLAPDAVSVPVFGATYRAPLGEAAVVDFALHLTGPTGVFKSELAALAQAHFGPGFHGKHLPAGWVDTSNMLEKKCFLAKDAILVVDDFAPAGTVADVQRLHREADRLFRAAGNRAGRARMRADGGARPTYWPRGLIISTGEDIPTGQSLRARLLILEVSPDDIEADALSAAQERATRGVLAAAMSGYLVWLAPQMDRLKEQLPARQRALRDVAARDGQHRRTPEVAASLRLGWESFVEFAEEIGALTVPEAEATLLRVDGALRSAGSAQAGHQATEEPPARFIALLASVISSGRGHLADFETGQAPAEPLPWGWRQSADPAEGYRAAGECLGWLTSNDLYLDPDTAYAVVQKLARDQGTTIALSPRTLWKRLDEKGLLATTDQPRGTRTIRRQILGRRRHVLHLRCPTLDTGTDQQHPETAQTAHAAAEKAEQNQNRGQFGRFGQNMEDRDPEDSDLRGAVGWEAEI